MDERRTDGLPEPIVVSGTAALIDVPETATPSLVGVDRMPRAGA